jgi:hypothetical protein
MHLQIAQNHQNYRDDRWENVFRLILLLMRPWDLSICGRERKKASMAAAAAIS